ncbi:hypothetical protein [Pectobacterium carotovorum]|uniref:F-box domain-containing protein n=1 Tax=Pectobacterium carotovorum TaxID=554 RepID=A0A419AW67_PECCA|nr:hypothetical protein [Pectobacterium carotovorum]RJL51293.1 hypothetical protein D5071_10930 [Pectobacterium carotovorum]
MLNELPNSKTNTPISLTQGSQLSLPEGQSVFFRKLDYISNLPVEIKEKIAFKLDAIDYNNLRNSSKMMRSDLKSIEFMRDKLMENNFSGKVREKYFPIFEKHIKKLLDEDVSDSLSRAIQHVYVYESKYFPDCFWLRSECYKCDNPRDNLLIICKNKVVKNICNKNPLMLALYGGGSDVVDVSICNYYLNKDMLDVVFKSFDTVFKEFNTNDRIFVAASSYILMEYLIDKTPNDIKAADVIACKLKYPELIETGRIAVDYLAVSASEFPKRNNH